MIEKILKITRIVLIVVAFLNILFNVRYILELGVNIKYNVMWLSPENLDTCFKYLNLHFIFLVILVVFLIWELVRDSKISNSNHHNNPVEDDD